MVDFVIAFGEPLVPGEDAAIDRILDDLWCGFTPISVIPLRAESTVTVQPSNNCAGRSNSPAQFSPRSEHV